MTDPTKDPIWWWELRRNDLNRRSVALEADVPRRIRDELFDGDLDPKLPPGPELRERLTEGMTLVLLIGTPGTGKTLAAVLALVDRGFGQFLTAPGYAHLVSSFRTSGLGERAADRTMLVVDDLGEEDERDTQKLRELLTHRYNVAGTSTTLVTTNLSAKEFGARYGRRIVSRFKDPRHSAIILCSTELRPQRGRS